MLGEMIVTCSIIGTRGPLLQVALILTKSPIERAFLFSPLLATTPVHPLPRLARRPGANPRPSELHRVRSRHKNYAVRGNRVDGGERSGGIACGRGSSMCLGEGDSFYVRSFLGL